MSKPSARPSHFRESVGFCSSCSGNECRMPNVARCWCSEMGCVHVKGCSTIEPSLSGPLRCKLGACSLRFPGRVMSGMVCSSVLQSCSSARYYDADMLVRRCAACPQRR